MDNYQFTWHTDQYGGWLEIPEAALAHVGATVADFSSDSRRRDRGTRCPCPALFLEEDIDADLFLRLYEGKFGHPADTIDKHLDRDHWIRELPALKEDCNG